MLLLLLKFAVQSSCGQWVNEWVLLCLNKTLFTGVSGGPHLACEHCFADPCSGEVVLLSFLVLQTFLWVSFAYFLHLSVFTVLEIIAEVF